MLYLQIHIAEAYKKFHSFQDKFNAFCKGVETSFITGT